MDSKRKNSGRITASGVATVLLTASLAVAKAYDITVDPAGGDVERRSADVSHYQVADRLDDTGFSVNAARNPVRWYEVVADFASGRVDKAREYLEREKASDGLNFYESTILAIVEDVGDDAGISENPDRKPTVVAAAAASSSAC